MKTFKCPNTYFILVFVCILSSIAVGNSPKLGIFYVVQGSSGAGTSWLDAFGNIQDAVDAASTAGGGEVWVAAGTYASTTSPQVTLAPDVHVYGGFAGTESSLEERDWFTNVTTIDGSQAFPSHGVFCSDNATLDGFTVTGNVFSAVYNNGVSPVIANCNFHNNGGGPFDGAGMYNENASPTVTNCIFDQNRSGNYGAGMYNDNSSPVVTNCVFSRNRVTGEGAYGGGMCNLYGSVPLITNCTFSQNSANDYGGAVYNGHSTAPVIVNSIFWDNWPHQIFTEPTATCTVTYSCVAGGHPGDGNIDANPLFVDASNGDVRLMACSPCIDTGTAAGAPADDIRGLSRPQQVGIDMGAYELLTSAYARYYVMPGGTGDGASWAEAICSVQQAAYAAASAGGAEIWVAAGTYASTTSPQVTLAPGVHIYGGFAGTETSRDERDWHANVTTLDGSQVLPSHGVFGADNATLDGFTVTGSNCAVSNNGVSPVIANCTFYDNDGIFDGIGMYNQNASPVVRNCIFDQNQGHLYGAGMYNNNASPVVTNCVFSDNSLIGEGACGGDMYNTNGSAPLITNCTFTQNSAGHTGGAVYNTDSAAPVIVNSIFWANWLYEIFTEPTATCSVTYSCVSGGHPGAGNISGDPLFVDLSNGDLRLRFGSPCTDTGTASGAPTDDISGVARPQGAGFDMGAHEFDNSAPIIDQGAGPLAVTMSEDGDPIPWIAPALSASDADTTDILTWSLLSPASHGMAVVSGTGASPTEFTYTPHENWHGLDSFEVQVSDGTDTAAIEIQVTVDAVQDPPVIDQIGPLAVTMSENGSPIPWSAPILSATDPDTGDTLTWTILTQAAHGRAIVSGTGALPAVFDYVPDAYYNGSDSFEIQVSDTYFTDSITVEVAIEPVNNAPVIDQNRLLEVTLSEDGDPVAWVAPALSATDVDGDTLTWSLLVPPFHGVATVSGTGLSPESFTYTPDAGYNGHDYFVIEVSDGALSDTIVVRVTVGTGPTLLSVTIPGGSPVELNVGDSHSFTAMVTGEQSDFHYQWYFQPAHEKDAKAFTPLGEANTCTLALINVSETQAGAYYCHVWTSTASAQSNIIQVIVAPGVPVSSGFTLATLVLLLCLIGARILYRKHMLYQGILWGDC